MSTTTNVVLKVGPVLASGRLHRWLSISQLRCVIALIDPQPRYACPTLLCPWRRDNIPLVLLPCVLLDRRMTVFWAACLIAAAAVIRVLTTAVFQPPGWRRRYVDSGTDGAGPRQASAGRVLQPYVRSRSHVWLASGAASRMWMWIQGASRQVDCYCCYDAAAAAAAAGDGVVHVFVEGGVAGAVGVQRGVQSSAQRQGWRRMGPSACRRLGLW